MHYNDKKGKNLKRVIAAGIKLVQFSIEYNGIYGIGDNVRAAQK
jgi:hypothetical protein